MQRARRPRFLRSSLRRYDALSFERTTKRCTRVNADSVAFLRCSALSLVARSTRTMGLNPPRRDVVAKFGVGLRCVSVLPCDAETCLKTVDTRKVGGEL